LENNSESGLQAACNFNWLIEPLKLFINRLYYFSQFETVKQI
jgi:hypothetical protein